MKLALPIALAGCLAIGSAAVHAESQSLNSFPNHVLPVLVRVDSHGKVTDVSSAVELTPHYERLLRATLDEMITKPASDHGKPVASQFVIKLGLQAKPRSDGKYDASFFYVGAQPVPAGRWIWQHEDGHRLALVNSEMIRNQFKHRWTNNGWFAPPPGLSAPRNPPPAPKANCTSAGHSGKP
ncbi:hypothetical protein [Dyella ginsengisoli]|uniref:hypothetical protein n=1 Tax=Dyella ginsengisoli TaxID=363848 RepID=UPI00035C5F1A|nr:hypothetical protein [Dyella ginsengisoli]